MWLKFGAQRAVGEDHMIRHFAPESLRIVTLAVALTPYVTSASYARTNDVSTASEWLAESNALTFTLREGVKLTLAPGTKVVRQPSIPVPRHLKDVAPRAYALELVSGRIDIDIDTKHKPVFSVMVRGPRRVAAFTTGGQSTIVASTEGIVLASVSGSELTASANDKWRSLKIGTALVVTRETPSGVTRDLPKTPELKASNTLKLSLAESAPTSLSWTAVPEARTYRISLYRRAGDSTPLASDYEVTTNAFDLPQLEKGLYTATVSAVDRWHLASPASNAVSVRVVGVQVPEGAYLVHGIPQLGKFQHVSLSQVQGLEMASGSAAIFGPAPETLGTPSGRPLLVRFRETGTQDEVQLQLEPRSFQGSVQFEPKGARWPGQAVKVVVKLAGPNGAALSELVNVSLNATVNARPIETRWAHEGQVWQTRIEQPPLSGPWVLRITVTDQGGQVLAHDFLEIAEARLGPASGTKTRYASQ